MDKESFYSLVINLVRTFDFQKKLKRDRGHAYSRIDSQFDKKELLKIQQNFTNSSWPVGEGLL